MQKAVISLSGGMDSSCLLVHLLANGYKEIKAVSFDYGQTHRIELEKAKSLVKYLNRRGFNITHSIVDLKSVGVMLKSALTHSESVPEGHYEQDNMKATVVPNRNVIFSSIVYAVAQSIADEGGTCDIALGIHAGDHAIYPDCRPESRDALEAAFKISNWNSESVNYKTPYLHKDKTGILRDCLASCGKLGLYFDEVLRRTITSYNPDSSGRSSGRSGSDIERIEAFLNIGRKDPIGYIDSWEEVVVHAKKVLGRD